MLLGIQKRVDKKILKLLGPVPQSGLSGSSRDGNISTSGWEEVSSAEGVSRRHLAAKKNVFAMEKEDISTGPVDLCSED